MVNMLSSLGLVFSVFFLSWVERGYYRSYFTPFSVTAWPFAIITLMVNFVAVELEFLPVTARANFFILLNLCLIWGVGWLMSFARINPLANKDYLQYFGEFWRFRPVLLILSWFVSGVVLLKVFMILGSEGMWFIGSADFEKKITVGFAAHMVQVGKVLLLLLLLLLWGRKKTWVDILTCALLIAAILIIKVKYHIVWVFLMVFFIKNFTQPPAVQLRRVINVVFGIVAVFVVNYLIIFMTIANFSFTNSKMWTFITGWLFNYLMSGPILLDQWMDLAHSKPWWSLLIVFINALNVITGNPERLSAVPFVSAGFSTVAPGFESNIGTAFGVYYLIGGAPLTLLATIVVAVLSYYFYVRAISHTGGISVYFASTFLTMGTLSFFVQYFTLLSLYEMAAIYGVFIGIFSFLNRLKS